jgi:hypothetical protein
MKCVLRKLAIAGSFAAAVLILGAGAASAQTLADPPPLLNGAIVGKTVYALSGIVDSATQATIVSCTSTARTGGSNITFGVEFFDNGVSQNDLTTGDGVTVVTPGDTDIISTRSVTGISEVPLGSPPVIDGDGTARVVSSSSSLICSAHVVDVATGEYRAGIPVFKKLKQGGS